MPPSGAADDKASSLMRSMMPKLLLSLLLGALFWWVIQKGGIAVIPKGEAAFAHVDWATIPIYVAILLVTHLVRAVAVATFDSTPLSTSGLRA